jgi:hypothetical protein
MPQKFRGQKLSDKARLDPLFFMLATMLPINAAMFLIAVNYSFIFSVFSDM